MKDEMEKDYAEIKYNGKKTKINLVEGTFGNKALDIENLNKKTGLITYDPGFQNTSAYKSEITSIDGTKGELRYRGVLVDELVGDFFKASRVDVATKKNGTPRETATPE